jgi:hypothetical protein
MSGPETGLVLPVGISPTVRTAFDDVLIELMPAMFRFPPWTSAHEGYGKIAEEFTELQGDIFTNEQRRDIAHMRHEAVQLAATAIRFIVDICDGGRGRA